MSATTRVDPLGFLKAELDALKAQGLYRTLRVLEGEALAHATYDHRSVVNLSSNNYLGLTTHPKLRQAALDAVREFGVGSGAVRTISGTMAMHVELERRLAAFKQVEAVVVFQSGFAANAGTVSAVLTKDDVIISDALNHASIIDGCRLSRAPIKVFPHKDVAAARAILEALPHGAAKLLITDGVFSMDGDLGAAARAVRSGRRVRLHHDGRRRPRQRRVRAAGPRHGRPLRLPRPRRHPGRHAVQGDRRARRLRRRHRATLITFLHHRARPFLFSTSHPPAVTAACLAALDVLETEPEWMERLWDNTRFFKAGLESLGFNTGMSESPITPVIVGEAALADDDVGPALRRGRLRAGHRVPDRGQGPGPVAHHRLGHPHPRRPAVRPRHHGQGRHGNSAFYRP